MNSWESAWNALIGRNSQDSEAEWNRKYNRAVKELATKRRAAKEEMRRSKELAKLNPKTLVASNLGKIPKPPKQMLNGNSAPFTMPTFYDTIKKVK